MITELRYLLEAAVRRAIKPYAKVGVLLSGGLDSSTVACLAPDLPLFTGWYEGDLYDERRYASLVARGREAYTFEIRPEDFVLHFPELQQIIPPGTGPGALGQFVLAKRIRDDFDFDTLLTGEGGDELFGGYARQLYVAGLPLPIGYENYRVPDGYPGDLGLALEQEWLALPDLLAVDQRVNGYWGLDVATPMLDPWVVAWVFAHPDHLRIGKQLLRRAMRGIVPDEILNRHDKRGFPVPFVAWAQKDPVRSFVKDRIGYLPNPDKPWDRKWWDDLLRSGS